jgi:serine protease Do
LIKNGRVARPKLGVAFNERLNDPIVRRMRLPGGALVWGVEPDSPAAAAGLRATQIAGGQIQPGDVIEQIDGKPVADVNELNALLERYNPGDKVKLGLFRDGERTEATVTLGKEGP